MSRRRGCIVREVIIDSPYTYRADMFLAFSLEELVRIWMYGLKITCLVPAVWKKGGTTVSIYDNEIIMVNGNKYSKKKLCLDWFQMDNDSFFREYGFSFNPHKYPGLYEWGRRHLYGPMDASR